MDDVKKALKDGRVSPTYHCFYMCAIMKKGLVFNFFVDKYIPVESKSLLSLHSEKTRVAIMLIFIAKFFQQAVTIAMEYIIGFCTRSNCLPMACRNCLLNNTVYSMNQSIISMSVCPSAIS